MCIASRYVHRNKHEECELTATGPQMYVIDIETDFLVNFNENDKNWPPPSHIPGYAPEAHSTHEIWYRIPSLSWIRNNIVLHYLPYITAR